MQTPEPATGEFGPLDHESKEILQALMKAPFPGREEIARQVSVAVGRRIDGHGCLDLSAVETVRAEVVRRIPVEAEVSDVDGVTIHVLLHVVDGYISALDIYREDGGDLRSPIQPEDLRLIVL